MERERARERRRHIPADFRIPSSSKFRSLIGLAVGSGTESNHSDYLGKNIPSARARTTHAHADTGVLEKKKRKKRTLRSHAPEFGTLRNFFYLSATPENFVRILIDRFCRYRESSSRDLVMKRTDTSANRTFQIPGSRFMLSRFYLGHR